MDNSDEKRSLFDLIQIISRSLNALLLILTIHLLVFSIFNSVFAQQPNAKSIGYNQNIGACEIDRFGDIIKKYREVGLDDFLKEICFILSAREKYIKVSHSLMNSRIDFFRKKKNEPGMSVPVSDEMKAILSEIRADVQKAIHGFSTKKRGVINIPEKLIGQLRAADRLLSGIAAGSVIDESSRYGYDVDLVNQRLGLALKYAIIWAKDGFN